MSIFPILAAQGYDNARAAAAPIQTDPKPRSEAAFGAAMGQFAGAIQQAETTAAQSMLSGANPHALVEALAATELAVDTAVSVRNKVVEAYLEILRMPV